MRNIKIIRNTKFFKNIKTITNMRAALVAAAVLAGVALAGGGLAGCKGQGASGERQTAGRGGGGNAQVLTGAAGADGSEKGQKSPAPGERHVNAAFFWIAADLDPAVDYHGWVTSRLGVGECLLKLNDQLELEGCIADSWENVDDTTWRFHIRDEVFFSNGARVTAESCKASIERAVSMNDRGAEYLKIASMEADGQTLTVKTTEPNAALPGSMAEPVFIIVDTSQSEEVMRQSPVCTGPYVAASFASEQRVELVKNDSYWGGEPGLDTVTVTQIADADARAMSVQSGEIDITNTIDNTSVTLFTDNPDYHVSSIISPRVNVAYMNHAQTSPLHDIQLRRAVSWAVDREAYAGLIGGSGAHGLYSDAAPFGNETVTAFSYDKAKAEDILEEAGYVDTDGDGYRENPDGSPLALRYLQAADHGSADSAILAAAVQSDLKAVGIRVEILAVENLSEYQSQGNFDFYTGNDNSAPTGDPQVWLETMYTGLGRSGKKNLTSFQNDEIDRIVAEMNRTFDTEKRYELAAEASQVLNDEAANLFLTNSYLNMVSSSRVKNAVQPAVDYYFITKDITVEQE